MYTGTSGAYSTARAVPTYDEFHVDKSQTFDNLFFEHKHKIMSLCDKLNDANYFKVRGLKRKLTALFIGSSGTGKTATVVALANYLKRVVIYVPIIRIENDGEIEKILYTNTYNGYIIPNHKKIFLFDEIDSFDSNLSLKKIGTDADYLIYGMQMPQMTPRSITKNNIIVTDQKQLNGRPDFEKLLKESDKEEEPKRKFNIGTFLNLLDGTHDQDGMIIIATANNLNRLDPGLYRTGRLTKILFEYMGRNEIAEMIEKYYSVTLSQYQKEMIRNDRIIQNLVLKNTCIEYLESNSELNSELNIDGLIQQLNALEEDIQFDKSNLSNQPNDCNLNHSEYSDGFISPNQSDNLNSQILSAHSSSLNRSLMCVNDFFKNKGSKCVNMAPIEILSDIDSAAEGEGENETCISLD
jgi:hypothetical protein